MKNIQEILESVIFKLLTIEAKETQLTPPDRQSNELDAKKKRIELAEKKIESAKLELRNTESMIRTAQSKKNKKSLESAEILRDKAQESLFKAQRELKDAKK